MSATVSTATDSKTDIAVDARVKDAVLYLTINRPKAMNALSKDVVAKLSATFEEYGGEVDCSGPEKPGKEQIRAIVLRGAGGNFCCGGDVKEMSYLIKCSNEGDLESISAYNLGAGKLFRAIENAAVPVIAVVEGVALGGGLGLACAVDITVAKKDAIFGLPETALGLVPAQVAPIIRRRVGESRARLMALVGGKFDGVEGERAGVVHYLVETDEELDATVAKLLAKIKICAPQAVACAKQLMNVNSPVSSFDPEQLGMVFAKHMASEEGREGTSAFVEKRKPSWCI
jgi:isohexenylglutaconyl-CoA hydratase